MKLNPDCVRDTLLLLEEKLSLNYIEDRFEPITLYQLTEAMLELHPNKYTNEDIWYTIYNLIQVRYIEGIFRDAGKSKMSLCNIENITWVGHQFLATIRPETIWEATKSKSKAIGGMSVSGLSLVASSVIQGLASNQNFIQSIVDIIK